MNGYLSISQTVQRLRKQFPDITASNLRYWEREELLAPRRTPGGHRLYSEEDVELIGLIKRLQAKRYYPLAVIRTALRKKKKQGATVLEDDLVGEELLRPLGYDPQFSPLSRKEIAAHTGVSAETIREMERMGLLLPARQKGTAKFDEDDVRLAGLARELMAVGIPLRAIGFYYPRIKALVQNEYDVMTTHVLRATPRNESPSVFKRLMNASGELRAYLHHKLLLEVIAQGEQAPSAGARRGSRPRR